MRAPLFEQIHPEWQFELKVFEELIENIDASLQNREITPTRDQIFRALTDPIESTRVVIFGQDPYPTQGHANGLAFSVDKSISPLPASLRNIYKELQDDLGVTRTNGDLGDWAEQGVMLINRILTTDVGKSLSHERLGWQEITESVARVLGKRNVIGVLWGNSAQQLRTHFSEHSSITSVHPSPLSAYRGFFGSKPFSQVNAKLSSRGFSEINW